MSVGETQKMNWKKGDSVPIFIDIDERKLLISDYDIIGTKFKMLLFPKLRKLMENQCISRV